MSLVYVLGRLGYMLLALLSYEGCNFDFNWLRCIGRLSGGFIVGTSFPGEDAAIN